MEKQKLELFSNAAVIRDDYARAFDAAEKKMKQDDADVKRKYNHSEPEFRESLAAIPLEFRKAVEVARVDAMHALDSEIETLRMYEENRVNMFDSPSFKDLSDLLHRMDGITVSVSEINVLTKRYANKNYWCDRLLSAFSEKNGVLDCPVQPTLEVKLQVLQTLHDAMQAYVDGYGQMNGNLRQSALSFPYVLDKQLARMEREYTNGYSGMTMSDEKAAAIELRKVQDAPIGLERAAILSNILNTAPDTVRDEIIRRLSDDVQLDDVTMKLTKVDIAVEAFKASGKADTGKALRERFEKLSPDEKDAIRLHAVMDGRGKGADGVTLSQSDFEWLQSDDYKKIVEERTAKREAEAAEAAATV